MDLIQTAIHSFEQGRFRHVLLTVVALCIVGGLGGYYVVKMFKGLHTQTGMEMAQVGRELAVGNGYTTKSIRPFVLKQLKDEGKPVPKRLAQLPEIVHPPVYPALLSVVFRVVNPPFEVSPEQVSGMRFFRADLVVVAFNLGCLMLAALVLFGWGWRMFDVRVGGLAVVLFLVTLRVWESSASGLPFPLLCLWICLGGWMLYESLAAGERGSDWVAVVWFSGAVVVMGLAALTSYHFLLFLPLLVVFGGGTLRQHVVGAVVALVLACVIVVPWLGYMQVVSGHPLGASWVYAFADSGPLPGTELWRSLDFPENVAVNMARLTRAFFLGVMDQARYLGVLMGGVVVTGLFFCSWLHPFRSDEVRMVKVFWFVGFMLLFLGGAAMFRGETPDQWMELNHLLVLVPVACLLGGAFFWVLVERVGFELGVVKLALVGLMIVMQGLPMGGRLMRPPQVVFAYPPYFPPILIYMQQWIEPHEVFSSDIPWANAWYSNRKTLWMPADPGQLSMLIDEYDTPLAGLLLTPESSNRKLFQEIRKGEYKPWSRAILNRAAAELPFSAGTPLPPENEYFFYSDRRRW